ncbi:VCBS domain-containing protein [Desulfovibrio piger]|uniref:VCBS domain-containing protein n=1 Tax=Desulfovibrio piger TaxID=901 RepID=UPI0026EEEE6D|nr:VCBS domain-containing protein [Desulfovibrio piger]
MADIRLAKPAAGTTQTVPSAPDGRFIFDFPADAATLTRNGDDLVLSFEDGSSIQLQGFYTTYSKEEMPSFQVEGVEISGQDFFAALGEDLMPAAGPAASNASRGGRYNEYGGSDLLDGIDHLGRLDIGFDGATQLATDTVEPSAPEVDIDYDVTITAGPEAGPVDLTVYEGGLAGGSQAGQAGTPTTASGSLTINAPDGVASIVIGGVVVFEKGALTGNAVSTDEGALTVTGFDPVTGELTFTYQLSGNTTEHSGSGMDDISHDLTVTVTDTDGTEVDSTITVNVVDDVPTVGSFSHKMSEGDAVPVVGNALSGAVAGADGADFAWDANQNGHFGTITLNADGTYSYRLDNDNATVKALSDGETLTEEFTYTYTDADGDIAEGKVTITINGKDNGIVIEPTDPAAGSDKVTVYESGLADGSQAGQDDAPTTASGSLIITAPDGVASIMIGGVVVFEKGALTGNAVPTDEGSLTVTDFDPVTGELKFTYELSGNTTEHSGSGMDDISHDLTVTVTDMDGTEVDSTITVNVVDDVPSISAEGVTVTEGGEASAAITPSYGADVPAGSTVTVKNGTYQESGDHAGSYEVANGWVTISADGKSYTFEAKPDIAPSVTSENITFEITDADGDKSTTEVTVNLEQAQGPVQDDGAQLTGSDTVTITVQDEHGNTFEVEIPVDIRDDVPSITASDMSSMVIPGSGAGNLENGEKASFTDENDAGHIIAQGSNLDGWDGVTMYAGKVTYTTDAAGNTIVREDGLDTSADSQLQYSTYPTEGKPSSDWGLMVSSPGDAQAWEINVSKDGQTSEAVIFDLGGQLAYGVTIDFGAFYNGKPGAEGTTQWDHVSEKALVTFYRDGKIVGSTIVEGNSSTGTFTLNSSDVILGGFDKVVISAVDNRTDEYRDEHSDFTIQGIDFITKRDDPIIINEGKVTAESGADGFADDYQEANAKFDLGSMVNDLSEDGTSGTITVLVNGEERTVDVKLSEGASGESILTGTIQGGDQLFTATLDKDGNWTMEQYEQFRVPGEGGESSNEFELTFKTEDADGDTGNVTVQVPLEVQVEAVNDADGPISNGDDAITITGGDGVAGTVAAGDTGGMTEGQQVEANYNVCFVLDTSGSMDEKIGGNGADRNESRLEVAVRSIENFVDTSIHNGDFVGTVNLAVVPFASEYGSTIDVSITRVSDGHGGYTETYTLGNQTYRNYQAFSTAFHNRLNDLEADGGTNYEAGFLKAAEWFDKLDDTSSADGNITYFLSDGKPTYNDTFGNSGWNTGSQTDKEDVQGAWHGYQELLGSASDMQVNAIGFGNGLDKNAMKTLAMLDNTGTPIAGVAGNQTADGLLYYDGGWWRPNTGTTTGGNATQVTNGDGLSAAFESGFKPGALSPAGNDAITAENSTSSTIIYGDVMNSDRLLHELKQDVTIADMVKAGMITALPGYGSGSEVFQWLEKNSEKLTGDYAGWTREDSIKYMLEHADELGYETRVDTDGNPYLVAPDGTVWNLDGSEAMDVDLDGLTGRGGGDDIITGSSASDIIYGQEGNDTIYGGSGHDTLYGGTGNDLLVGDNKPESLTADTVEEISGLSKGELDAFIESVEGTDADGNDRLFGGSGDDVLLGMGGDDYLDGGEGSDAIFGGAGNDIIVYDQQDYLVSGGSGIDFMVSDDTSLTLEGLLSNTGSDKPLVSGIEVLLKGEDALSLTSIKDLADRYGITLGVNEAGEETLQLDDRWTKQADGSYDFNGGAEADGGLTLETNLTPVETSDPASEAVQQQVFTLEHSNG